MNDDGDGENRDENVRGGAVGVLGPDAYLFDSLLEGRAHVDGSLAFGAVGLDGCDRSVAPPPPHS